MAAELLGFLWRTGFRGPPTTGTTTTTITAVFHLLTTGIRPFFGKRSGLKQVGVQFARNPDNLPLSEWITYGFDITVLLVTDYRLSKNAESRTV